MNLQYLLTILYFSILPVNSFPFRLSELQHIEKRSETEDNSDLFVKRLFGRGSSSTSSSRSRSSSHSSGSGSSGSVPKSNSRTKGNSGTSSSYNSNGNTNNNHRISSGNSNIPKAILIGSTTGLLISSSHHRGNHYSYQNCTTVTVNDETQEQCLVFESGAAQLIIVTRSSYIGFILLTNFFIVSLIV